MFVLLSVFRKCKKCFLENCPTRESCFCVLHVLFVWFGFVTFLLLVFDVLFCCLCVHASPPLCLCLALFLACLWARRCLCAVAHRRLRCACPSPLPPPPSSALYVPLFTLPSSQAHSHHQPRHTSGHYSSYLATQTGALALSRTFFWVLKHGPHGLPPSSPSFLSFTVLY